MKIQVTKKRNDTHEFYEKLYSVISSELSCTHGYVTNYQHAEEPIASDQRNKEPWYVFDYYEKIEYLERLALAKKINDAFPDRNILIEEINYS